MENKVKNHTDSETLIAQASGDVWKAKRRALRILEELETNQSAGVAGLSREIYLAECAWVKLRNLCKTKSDARIADFMLSRSN